MITKQDLKMLFDKGQMQFGPDPALGSIACYIWYGMHYSQANGNWFWFGGMEADECTASEYLENVGFDECCEEAARVINEFRTGSDSDEYEFYKAIIEEAKRG